MIIRNPTSPLLYTDRLFSKKLGSEKYLPFLNTLKLKYPNKLIITEHEDDCYVFKIYDEPPLTQEEYDAYFNDDIPSHIDHIRNMLGLDGLTPLQKIEKDCILDVKGVFDLPYPNGIKLDIIIHLTRKFWGQRQTIRRTSGI